MRHTDCITRLWTASVFTTALLFTTALFLCVALAFCQEARTWKDDTGMFSIEATFQQIDGESVKLERTDGRIVTLPISRLSEADQRHIVELTAKNPFEGDDPVAVDPFAVDTDTSANRGWEVPANNIRAVDLSQARQAGGVMPITWNCEPDPAPQREYPSDVVRLNFHMANTSAPINFFISPTGKTAVGAMNVASSVDMAAQQAATRARMEAQQAAARARMEAMRAGNTPPPATATTPAPTPEPIDDGRKGRTRIFIADTVTGNTITHDTPLKLVPFGFSPN